jgi:ABC-type multidrug transport system ATPase subunit
VAPLISTSSLRVDVGGAPAIDGLTFTSTGERVLILGAAPALFAVAAGLRATSRGEVRVEGAPPLDAVRRKTAAGAPLDPPLPPRWSARQYVVWSARVAGHERAHARELAAQALARTRVDSVADARLGAAALTARRATVIAAALATGAATLLLEDPLCGLPSESVAPFARVLSRALADRRTAIFASRVPLESPLALDADEAVVVVGSHVAAQGAPAEIASAERSYWLRVLGDVDAFARAVEERGGRLLSSSGKAATAGSEPAEPPVARTGAGQIGIDLGPLGTRDLISIASDVDATLLELRPISVAFA